ncbi:hypothetical protein L204_104432 [Cryptococcus depauperatus]
MLEDPLLDDCDPTFTHFSHRSQFLKALGKFLQLDVCQESSEKQDEQEEAQVAHLGGILDYYLPMPGLLDPSLHEIVPPLMNILENALRIMDGKDTNTGTNINSKRIERLGRVINWVVKVRGWKIVVTHFSSAIPNLSMLVSLLSPPATPNPSVPPTTPHHPTISSPSAWELRAVLLIWLAMLLTMPFNLLALSDSNDPISSIPYGIDMPSATILFKKPTSKLAQRVSLLAILLLKRPGNEGAYAALVLARLLSREDAVHGLSGFLEWVSVEVREEDREGEASLIASLFKFLSLMPSLLKAKHLPLLEVFLEEQLLPHLRGSRTAAESGLIRKLAIKAKGRLWMTKLGKKYQEGEALDFPLGLEAELNDLMCDLSDKDTIVRYSSAKYLARIASLLPASFSSQIVLATIALFQGTEDEPVITTSFGTIIDPGGSSTVGGTMGFEGLETQRGEARWHGVCLALAEMARRGLILGEAIEESVSWVLKALNFDLRRASHSIGSNVRDAAAYLLWSLSRACPPKVLEFFAEKIATSLVCVAVFDREVGVRRAASAAFQEGVGRLGLYPKGIDVLAKTDFYSVSVRRIAFTVAAPAVGIHEVYREKMLQHLHNITLRHWDCVMRVQGALALNSLLKFDSGSIEKSMQQEIENLSSIDSMNAHGALTALCQIAQLFKCDDERNLMIFEALSTIRPVTLVSQQAADILSVICNLLNVILNRSILELSCSQSTINHFLDLAGMRKESDVHESMAKVYFKLSILRNVETDIEKLIGDLKSYRVSQRQAAALSLGHIQYPPAPSAITEKVIEALLGLLQDPDKVEVESRRWAVRSLADIVAQQSDGHPVVSSLTYNVIIRAHIAGLSDYTTDQRGDVGSWVRIASLKALSKDLSSLTPITSLLEINIFDQVIGGIIKQAVEKLESVRLAAALALAEIKAQGWTWEGDDALAGDLSLLKEEGLKYIDAKEWYRGYMPLVKSKYREEFMSGLVFSVGSQVGTLSEAAFQPLRQYLADHNSAYLSILSTLLFLLNQNFKSNRIFIPTLQTVYKLFAARIWETVTGDNISDLPVKIMIIATKGLGSIKSIERISTAMRIVITCLSMPFGISSEATGLISLFLAHRFPRIRAMASEEIYLTLSGMDEEMEEELEDTLLETDWASPVVERNVEKVVKLLQKRT